MICQNLLRALISGVDFELECANSVESCISRLEDQTPRYGSRRKKEKSLIVSPLSEKTYTFVFEYLASGRGRIIYSGTITQVDDDHTYITSHAKIGVEVWLVGIFFIFWTVLLWRIFPLQVIFFAFALLWFYQAGAVCRDAARFLAEVLDC